MSRPYRWLWKTIFLNLASYYYDLKNGIHAYWVFRKTVWHFRSWDFSGLLKLMETATSEMYCCHRDYAHYVGAERTAKQLLIVRELCKRLREDKYFKKAGYDSQNWDYFDDFDKSRIVKHSVYMAEQDAVYLGKMMRHVQKWWD